MEINKLNEGIKSLQLIHLALCLGVAFFLAITIFLNATSPIAINDSTLTNAFYVVVSIFSVLGIVVSTKIKQVKLNTLRGGKLNDDSLLAEYRGILIIQFALIEGPAFSGIVFYMLTGEYAFAIIALALLVYLWLQRPSEFKIKEDLQLGN